MSLKMLGSDGTGPVSNILDAAAWLLKNSIDGANPNADNQTNAEVLGVDVINMSFGYSSTSTSPQAVTVCEIFAALRADGVAAAAAAGRCEPAGLLLLVLTAHTMFNTQYWHRKVIRRTHPSCSCAHDIDILCQRSTLRGTIASMLQSGHR